MKKLLNFLMRIHSAAEDASAKRFYGGLIILTSLVVIYMVAWGITPVDVWKELSDTLEYVVVIAAGLLGAGAVVDIFKIRRQDPKP